MSLKSSVEALRSLIPTFECTPMCRPPMHQYNCMWLTSRAICDQYDLEHEHAKCSRTECVAGGKCPYCACGDRASPASGPCQQHGEKSKET